MNKKSDFWWLLGLFTAIVLLFFGAGCIPTTLPEPTIGPPVMTLTMPTATVTQTALPPSATPTPIIIPTFEPTVTATNTPTLAPTIMFTPTLEHTPTQLAIRYTAHVPLLSSQGDCSWYGVIGQVFSEPAEPTLVRVFFPGGGFVDAIPGSDKQWGPTGWSVSLFLGSTPSVTFGVFSAVVIDPETGEWMSEKVFFPTGNTCETNVTIMNFNKTGVRYFSR